MTSSNRAQRRSKAIFADGRMFQIATIPLPDGNTLFMGHIGTLAVNPYIFDKLPYDPVQSFRPISLLAKVPSLYVVRPELPVKNLKEFVAYAKSKPGQLNYGWAQLTTTGGTAAGFPASLLGYAYDNTGAPLTAGQVPEPHSSWMLAIPGLTLLFRRKGRPA